MSTSLTIRFSRKVMLAVLASVAVLASMLAVLYQKTLAPLSSRGIARLGTVASCTAPAQGSATNERKQLFVSCAGFLN